MSPTTLYREGTDLDALLAELDDQYPDRVRVVEVSHPREGGMLGFFAKQRVGVHYRLVEPGRGGHSPAASMPSGYDAVPGAAPAAGAAPGVGAVSDGGTLNRLEDVDLADTRAGLVADAGPTATTGPADDAPAGGRAGAESSFADILAQLAVRSSAAGASRPQGPAGDATPVRLGPSPEALARARDRQRSTPNGPPQPRTDPVPAMRATAPPAPQPSTPQPPPAAYRSDPPPAWQPPAAAPAAPDSAAAAPAAPAATSAAAPTVPAAAPAAPAAGSDRSSVAPAFTSLPRVSHDGTDLPTPPPAAAPPRRSQPAAPEPRTGTLDWPLAAGRGAQHHNPASSVPTDPAPAVIPEQRREPTEAPVATPAVEPPAMPATPGHFTLRRQLVEIGVPIDRIPDDAAHPYAAIEQLVNTLPAAGEPPQSPGEILVIAGPAQHALTAAETLVCAPDSRYEEVWTYGCASGIGRRKPETRERTLASATHAAQLAAQLRDDEQGPALIVIATDGPTWTGRPAELIAAIGPDALWTVVDATVKPGDARQVLADLGPVNAVAVANATRTSSPATAWELPAPIALLDGRPSTSSSWAVLLLDKLSQLEQQCSVDQC